MASETTRLNSSRHQSALHSLPSWLTTRRIRCSSSFPPLLLAVRLRLCSGTCSSQWSVRQNQSSILPPPPPLSQPTPSFSPFQPVNCEDGPRTDRQIDDESGVGDQKTQCKSDASRKKMVTETIFGEQYKDSDFGCDEQL